MSGKLWAALQRFMVTLASAVGVRIVDEGAVEDWLDDPAQAVVRDAIYVFITATQKFARD